MNCNFYKIAPFLQSELIEEGWAYQTPLLESVTEKKRVFSPWLEYNMQMSELFHGVFSWYLDKQIKQQKTNCREQ